jgi:hypothetical protein
MGQEGPFGVELIKLGSAGDRPESALGVLPERRVEFRRRQIED